MNNEKFKRSVIETIALLKELGLADIKPDVDLLGLGRNTDVDFGEDNWAIDVMNEEKIKRYLTDSIALLKEQAIEAKKANI